MPVGGNYPNHLEIWDLVMKRIHNICISAVYDDELLSFSVDSVVLQPYCTMSGMLPTEECELSDSEIKYGYYIEKYLPNDICSLHNDIYNQE
jgi:hypothetical protein